MDERDDLIEERPELDSAQVADRAAYVSPDIDSVRPEMVPTLLGTGCGTGAGTEEPCTFE